MLTSMNKKGCQETIEFGEATYQSRFKNNIWVKGETFGHGQFVKTNKIDCDNDALFIVVNQVGTTCHTGIESWFFSEIEISLSQGFIAQEQILFL